MPSRPPPADIDQDQLMYKKNITKVEDERFTVGQFAIQTVRQSVGSHYTHISQVRIAFRLIVCLQRTTWRVRKKKHRGYSRQAYSVTEQNDELRLDEDIINYCTQYS